MKNQITLYVGVMSDLGCTLQYVKSHEREWFIPFTTSKKADGLHTRIAFTAPWLPRNF